VPASQGIQLVPGDGIEALEGNGVLERVRTSSGKVIDCDFAVIGVGVVPRVDLATSAGAKVDAQPGTRGGAGDAWRAGRLRPAPVLLLGPVRRRHGVPGLRDELGSGRAPRRPKAGEFIAFWLEAGKVLAGMNVNV
jgi:3-phenylpropionate/trans-cinnamate dioxygenase ferredoxin reductase subunit